MRAYLFHLVLFSSPLFAQQRQEVARAAPTPIIIGHEVKLESKVLGETREIMIGVPRDYEQSKSRCGIAYLLDGDALFATAVAAVRHNEKTQLPLIVVGIKNTNRFRDLTPKQVSPGTEGPRMPGGGGAAPFRRFLVEELRPYLAANYRTNDLSLLIGHSLGGLFTFDALVHQPDAFTGYFCMSPSLWWDNQSLLEQFKDLPSTHPLYSRFVYLSVGDESGSANVPVKEVEWHFKEHAPPSFRWHVRHFPGKDHWPVASPSLYEGLFAFFTPLTELRKDKNIRSFDELKKRNGELLAHFGVEVPLSVDAVSRMAGRVARWGSPEAALKIIDDAESTFPDTFDLPYVRGHLLVELKRFDEAVKVLETLLERSQDEGATKRSIVQRMLSAAKKARDDARSESKGGKRENAKR